MKKEIFSTVFMLSICLSAHSQSSCTDKEYKIYQQYDAVLEAYPNIPASDLRVQFAARVGMKPSDLRDLHTRCTGRWANKSPKEAAEYVRKGVEEMRKECAMKRVQDEACRALSKK